MVNAPVEVVSNVVGRVLLIDYSYRIIYCNYAVPGRENRSQVLFNQAADIRQ